MGVFRQASGEPPTSCSSVPESLQSVVLGTRESTGPYCWSAYTLVIDHRLSVSATVPAWLDWEAAMGHWRRGEWRQNGS